MTPSQELEIPEGVKEWRRMREGRGDIGMLEYTRWVSGSKKMQQFQFLSLRAYWEKPYGADSLLTYVGRHSGFHSKEWSAHLKLINPGQRTRLTGNCDGWTMLDLVHWEQLLISNIDEAAAALQYQVLTRSMTGATNPRPEPPSRSISPEQRRAPALAQAASERWSQQSYSASSQASSNDTTHSNFELPQEAVRAPDETIVQGSLNPLLDALLRLAGLHRLVETSPERHGFTVHVPNTNGEVKLYSAHVDGFVRILGGPHEDFIAIIECKAFERSSNFTDVRAQETAEIVGDIAQNTTAEGHRAAQTPDGAGFWRCLIAQDYDKLYVVIAEYDWEYVRYVKFGTEPATRSHHRIKKPAGFLRLREFGPFDVFRSHQLNEFAQFFVGLARFAANGNGFQVHSWPASSEVSDDDEADQDDEDD